MWSSFWFGVAADGLTAQGKRRRVACRPEGLGGGGGPLLRIRRSRRDPCQLSSQMATVVFLVFGLGARASIDNFGQVIRVQHARLVLCLQAVYQTQNGRGVATAARCC